MPPLTWLKRKVADAWTIPTLDLLFVLLMILILLPHSRADDPAETPPGTLVAEIQWPFAHNSDVDLWLLAPGGGRAVGYSNKGGLLWNLLRDDLGSTTGDISEANFEVSYSRGIVDGEYQLNVHMYRTFSDLPVTVAVVVKLNIPENNTVQRLFAKRVELVNIGQELTVFRWTMRDGKFVPGSLHDIPRGIRTRQRQPDQFGQ